MIRKEKLEEKRENASNKKTPYRLTCEAAPHHLALNEETAARLGAESFGRVNPPLRTEEDREAVIAGIVDGTIDAIATDHAPHTDSDKAAGAPGFSGLETSFAAANTALVRTGVISLKRLSALMSAQPAHILGLSDRGIIEKGLRSDFVIVDPDVKWLVQPELFKSRGKNSPFAGEQLFGKVMRTILNERQL
jgi:dihydroorotase